MMLDHIGFSVHDYGVSKAFYEKALAPLGITVILGENDWGMLGRDGVPQVWFGAYGEPAKSIHVAFAAKDRAQVRAFHEAALAAGGKDHGAPGIREQYHPNYYGAFVFDPDGNNIEAVCHTPEE